MDPVETKDESVLKIRKQVEETASALDPLVSIHDFRMVEGNHQANLIFDMVVPHQYSKEEMRQIKERFRQEMKKKDVRYECVITVEKSFVASEGTEEA